MRVCFLLLLQATVFLHFGFCESLWDSQFEGYYSEKQTLRPGDSFTVLIDTSSGIQYEASRSGDKELVLEFSGGEGSDMFSFLPGMSSFRNEVSSGDETYTFQTELAVRVQEIDDNGNGLVQGSRTVTLQGAVQSVTLNGWIAPSDVTQDRRISFNRITDLRFTYRSFLEAERPVLTEDDIREIVARAEQTGEQPAEIEDEETAPEQPADALTDEIEELETAAVSPAGGTEAGGYTLTEEKKRELLLLYMNSFLDLLFPPGGN